MRWRRDAIVVVNRRTGKISCPGLMPLSAMCLCTMTATL